MILGSHRLNVNDLSIGLAKPLQQSSDIADDGFDSGAVSFTTFSLHVDNDETGPLRRKLDCPFSVHSTSRNAYLFFIEIWQPASNKCHRNTSVAGRKYRFVSKAPRCFPS